MRPLPWWIRPWHACKRCHRILAHQSETIRRQSNAAAAYRDEIRRLEQQLEATLSPSVPEGALTGKPEFVLTGQDRGNGMGKRLMASKDLGPTSMAMTDMDDPPPRWKLETVMGGMLIIDKPTYGAALEHMTMVWRNWERESVVAAIPASNGEYAPKPEQRGAITGGER